MIRFDNEVEHDLQVVIVMKSIYTSCSICALRAHRALVTCSLCSTRACRAIHVTRLVGRNPLVMIHRCLVFFLGVTIGWSSTNLGRNTASPFPGFVPNLTNLTRPIHKLGRRRRGVH
jgi:hypothetical protein